MLAFHGRLAVEGLQQLWLTTVVIGDLPDGNLHQLPRVVRPHHNLAQLDGRRHQSDLQFLRFAGRQTHLPRLISQVRDSDRLRHLVQFQGKHPIFVCHHRHTAGRDTHLSQDIARLVILHTAAHHHLLGGDSQLSQQQDE